jgi:hypothetical protein
MHACTGWFPSESGLIQLITGVTTLNQTCALRRDNCTETTYARGVWRSEMQPSPISSPQPGLSLVASPRIGSVAHVGEGQSLLFQPDVTRKGVCTKCRAGRCVPTLCPPGCSNNHCTIFWWKGDVQYCNPCLADERRAGKVDEAPGNEGLHP